MVLNAHYIWNFYIAQVTPLPPSLPHKKKYIFAGLERGSAFLLDCVRFKNEVKELCNIVEQLLNDALSVACNIEDALNILQSLHYFSYWPQLHSQFQKKTNDVYAMLIDDISLAMQFYTDNSYEIPSFMAQYSGVCITAMTEYKRIETLKNVSIPCPRVSTTWLFIFFPQ